MLKFLLAILSIALSSFGFAQENFRISGKVSDPEHPAKKIYAVKVMISFSDSTAIELDADTIGTYSVNLPLYILGQHTITVTVRQDFKKLEELFPPPKDCPIYWSGPDYYYGSGTRVILPKQERVDIVADFFLNKMIRDFRLPCLAFEKNKTEFVSCGGDDPEMVMHCLRYMLVQNPTIIVRLNGYACHEWRPRHLSTQRAEYVKEKFVALGVDSQRIVTVGCGRQQPLVTKAILKKAKRSEREQLETLNRRVELSIISWDYDPIKMKKLKQPAKPDQKTGDEK